MTPGLFHIPTILFLNDVLDSSERQNLKSGSVVSVTLYILIVIIFGVVTLIFRISPRAIGIGVDDTDRTG